MSAREPLFDIVMLVHDQAGWADLAIRAVEAHTKNPYRLIIVDSASVEPKTHAMLKEAEDRGHTVVRLAENRSFSHGVNVGVGVGKSKFIVLLNDDAIVTEGWDGALLQDASEKGIGLVGARSNYAAGWQGDPKMIGDPLFLVFVCVAMRREVWSAVGPMDEETFDGFSTEDLDYSWRVVKAGYKLKVSNAYVLHAGSRTLAATTGAFQQRPDGTVVMVGNNAEARRRNDQKYGERLEQKWGKEWVKQHTNPRMKGLVVTYHAEEWTRVEFLKNLIFLRASDVAFEYLQVSRAPIHMARQLAADFALDHGFDWFVQIDDDATFPPDVLRRLLAHNKDVVCALAYQRKPPHLTCAFEIGEDGILGRPLEGIEHTGLRKVDVSGFHCSIMRTSVIKRLRDAGIKQYFGGFDNKVGEDFAFPVAPETPVLGVDWRWRPIVDFAPGEEVVGFDEHSLPHSSRRFRSTVVTGVIKKVLPRLRVVTDEAEVVTTAEHPWLSNFSMRLAKSRRWDWRPAGVLKPGMVVAAVTPVVTNPNLNDPEYLAGYVQGIFHSDGYQTSTIVNGHRYDHFIVKMKDTEPLERLATALAMLGVESRRGAVQWSGNPRHAPMHKLGVERQEQTRKLRPIVETTSIASVAFAAGYLAGKYDGDGSHYGGSLFVHSIVDWKKDRLEEAARVAGVPFTARDGRNVRICGQDNIFRFWQATSPSLVRRMSLEGQINNARSLRDGKEVKHRPVVVRAVEKLGAGEVFCLTTRTATFIAGGLASHNCLNLKKVGVQVYCDTELISGHIGASVVVDEAYKKQFLASQGK